MPDYVAQPQLLQMALDEKDIVYTPDWVARDMVEYFKPAGKILEPCIGEGAFIRQLPENTLWCEIRKGRDFFTWNETVDWIIGNPPYRLIKEWLQHSFCIANDIVYLMPMNSPFNSMERMRIILNWGGIKVIRAYGNGSLFGMDYGFAVGAFWFQRDYRGGTDINYCECEEITYKYWTV